MARETPAESEAILRESVIEGNYNDDNESQSEQLNTEVYTFDQIKLNGTADSSVFLADPTEGETPCGLRMPGLDQSVASAAIHVKSSSFRKYSDDRMFERERRPPLLQIEDIQDDQMDDE